MFFLFFAIVLDFFAKIDIIGVFVISYGRAMKKRILSLLILSIYFFGGSGMVFAYDC